MVGYEGFYEVSNCGRVRGVDRWVDGPRGIPHHVRQRIKTLTENRDGYYIVSLSRDGNTRKFFVHRLVYVAFVGDIPDGYDVNHIDFNRQNNNLDNLELLTHHDNVAYTFSAGRHYTQYTDLHGENNPNYGNRKLSQIYAENPDLAKEKQGRPGLQNGRCKKTLVRFKNGDSMEFGCAKHCAIYLVESGASDRDVESVASAVRLAANKGRSYLDNRYYFI